MNKKADITALVTSNIAIGPCFYCLTLKPDANSQELMAKTMPGQFGQIKIEDLSSPKDNKFPVKQNILRKPFSFSAIDIDSDGTVSVKMLYCVLGSGTERMTTLKKGDSVKLLAPLGNGFTVRDDQKNAILVGGGMGAAPLQSLAQYIQRKRPKIQVYAFIGAKTVKGLPFFHTHDHLEQGKVVTDIAEFGQYGTQTFIATDDGSAGFKGVVTDLLDKKLKELDVNKDKSTIYTCGPEIMMYHAARFARHNDFKCQVSLERRMACGIGLCQSCAVECKVPGESETMYKLCCKDGPVFDAEEVKW